METSNSTTSDEDGIMINDIQATFAQHGFSRPQNDRWLGGVCAGLGRGFGISPNPARLLFVLLLLLIPGSQILVYPALWILMPADPVAAGLGYSPASHG